MKPGLGHSEMGMVPGNLVVRKGFMEVKGEKRKESNGRGLGPGRQNRDSQFGMSGKEGFVLLAQMGGV